MAKCNRTKKDSKKMIMSYYGQWSIYGGKFPVPLKSSLYNDITHLVYGFMGFNDKGLLGSWDGWADFGNFNTTGKNEPYGPQFINAFWGIGSKGPPDGIIDERYVLIPS